MRKGICICVMVAVLGGLPPTVGAQATIPVEALAAEGRLDWNEALRLYRELLERDAQRVDIWLRVSDIHARLGQGSEAIAALDGALRADKSDPELYARLSRAYAAADQPKAALSAIQGALALRPDDPAYLKACGELASWSGEYEVAQRAYESLLRLTPGDAAAAGRTAWLERSGRTPPASRCAPPTSSASTTSASTR